MNAPKDPSRFAELDTLLRHSVEGGDVPGVIGLVADASSTLFSSAWGVADTESGGDLTPNSLVRMASQAKLPTTILVLQLVERGLLDLDTPVGDIVPEFDDLQVLDGFDGDTPRLRVPIARATVKQLLTHTSGLAYNFWNKDLDRFGTLTELPTLGSGLRAAFRAPLVSDPGARFMYGMGMDWAGLVVEALVGAPLDRCVEDQIFGPLEMADSSLWMRQDQRDRVARVHIRDAEGLWRPTAADYYENQNVRPEFFAGGHSLYSTPNDYLRLQQLLLNGGSLGGVDVLEPGTVDLMFENQIGDLDVGIIESADAATSVDVDLTGQRWSLGLLHDPSPAPGMRSTDSAGWAGGFNSFYWVDRAAGLAVGLYTQTLPFYEEKVAALYEEFERALYRAI